MSSTPMLEQLRALAPADRALVLEGSAAVAQSFIDDLEAARAGDRRPINLHGCDVLGMATALIFTIEQIASRDRALAAWETAAHATAPESPTVADQRAELVAEIVGPAVILELDAARATIAASYRALIGGERTPEHADLPSVCRAMRASLIERRRQVAELKRATAGSRVALVADVITAGVTWISHDGGAVLPAGTGGELLANMATALIALIAHDQQPAPALTDDRIREERDAARFAGDHETARLCCAALGLPTGDGAHGLLDAATSRARLAHRLNLTASKDPAP